MTYAKDRLSNKLIDEKSPYLLQHAHNPVKWYPWNSEAFDKAKQEGKPIFLSIGYSTCHWCHVMERESFEDEEVAEILNENYISIKVDREERPDLDAIYMAVCQAMTGQGGWPLTVIMTPDKKPFFAGTYFPKKRKYGRPGIMELLDNLWDLWQNEREKLLNAGDAAVRALEDSYYQSDPGEIEEDILDSAYHYYEKNFDFTYGGFSDSPKFPTPHNLTFLLRYWKMTGNEKALEMVEKTLQSMYLGGIYDHIGLGFARYSTDEKWLVPHFEKMLYDNALLAIAYLECYQATDNEFYGIVAKEIFTYVLRDMTSKKGGFFSAEDADSEGVEGKFYVWSPREIVEVLGEERGRAYCKAFDITEKGNFEGKSIPNLIGKDPIFGQNFTKEREELFLNRETRIHPFKDDKILTAWNGLMIAALAIGARVLGVDKYSQAAEMALEFINSKLRIEGRLYARYRDGETAYLAYVDDYAFLVWGLIELYQTTFKPKYLKMALEYNQEMLDLFWDDAEGGLFFYGHDAEDLITRPKELYDGALPSGNSLATLNFLRLAAITGDQTIFKIAKKQLNAFGGTINQSPPGYSQFLSAVYLSKISPVEITIVGKLDKNDTKELLNVAQKGFDPGRTIVVKEPSQADKLEELIPGLKDKNLQQGGAAAFVCSNFSCKPPVMETQELQSLLGSH